MSFVVMFLVIMSLVVVLVLDGFLFFDEAFDFNACRGEGQLVFFLGYSVDFFLAAVRIFQQVLLLQVL